MSTNSLSNQNDEPETRHFVFRFEKNRNETTKRRFSHRFQNAAQHYKSVKKILFNF